MEYQKSYMKTLKELSPDDYARHREKGEYLYCPDENAGTVICVLCGKVVYEWLAEWIPPKVHRPHLDFCCRDKEPIDHEDELREIKWIPVFTRSYVMPDPVNLQPRYPKYSNINARLQTFNTWPLFPARRYAEIGIFHTGVPNSMMCFCCGASFKYDHFWPEPEENHALASPDCLMVLGNSVEEAEYDYDSGRKQQIIIKQAKELYNDALVEEMVFLYGRHFDSFRELCELILQFKVFPALRKVKARRNLNVDVNANENDTSG